MTTLLHLVCILLSLVQFTFAIQLWQSVTQITFFLSPLRLRNQPPQIWTSCPPKLWDSVWTLGASHAPTTLVAERPSHRETSAAAKHRPKKDLGYHTCTFKCKKRLSNYSPFASFWQFDSPFKLFFLFICDAASLPKTPFWVQKHYLNPKIFQL